MRSARLLPVAAALAAELLLSTAALAAAWEAIERLPGQSPVTVLVQDKPRIYFRITPQAPLTVPIEGPARLRVVSRLELPPGSKQVVSYTVRVAEGGKELDHGSTEASVSDQAFDPERKHAIGKSRRMTVDVPAGRHALTLSIEGAPALLVRLQQAAPAGGEETTVTLTPIEAPRSVMVQEGEKSIPYSSVMPGRPVKLRLVGPTSLDLICRLDFDATMRGTQAYRLGISDRGKRIRELQFKTTKTTTAVYTDLADRVPSKFDKVRLLMGAGPHEITIELLAPPQGSAEVHARIPQPAVGTEE